MYIQSIDPEAFIPFFVFAIPIVAIVGGITAGIIRTLGRQRLIEMAQRERIAAIERGIDPAKLPPLPMSDDDAPLHASVSDVDRRRAQGLMVGGIITTAVGAGLMVFLFLLGPETGERGVWAVGVIPMFVGLALLLSAWLIRPRNGSSRV